MAIKLRNLPAPLTHDLEKAVNSSIQLIEKEKNITTIGETIL
jgi:hypothetical protein